MSASHISNLQSEFDSNAVTHSFRAVKVFVSDNEWKLSPPGGDLVNHPSISTAGRKFTF